MVNVLSEGPASQTGPELLRFRNIVALDAQDAIVFYVQLKRASPTTVKGRSGTDDFNIAIGLAVSFITHLYLQHALTIFYVIPTK
jgi:hypothetical protein